MIKVEWVFPWQGAIETRFEEGGPRFVVLVWSSLIGFAHACHTRIDALEKKHGKQFFTREDSLFPCSLFIAPIIFLFRNIFCEGKLNFSREKHETDTQAPSDKKVYFLHLSPKERSFNGSLFISYITFYYIQEEQL